MDRVGGQKIRKQAVRYCPFTPWLLQSLSKICHQRVRTDAVPSLSPMALAIFKDVKEVISAWCRTIDLDMHPQKKRENSQDPR